MIYKKKFSRNLVKAELDIDGDKAVLRIDVDSVIAEKRRAESVDYALKEDDKQFPPFEYDMKTKKFHVIDAYESADRTVEGDIEEGVRFAREWAQKKTKKKIRIVYAE